MYCIGAGACDGWGHLVSSVQYGAAGRVVLTIICHTINYVVLCDLASGTHDIISHIKCQKVFGLI